MTCAPFSPITDFKNNFEFAKSDTLFERLNQHDVGGVYTIALANVYDALVRHGYRALPEMPEVWSGDHFHAYVGETYSLKQRMGDHLLGEGTNPTFRKTLAMVLELSDLELTRFLNTNALIGYRYFPYMGDVERYLIENTACPLNLRGKGRSDFARRLRAMLRERRRPV